MTFKEVFQRYKEGTASLEEIKFVEEELRNSSFWKNTPWRRSMTAARDFRNS